MHESSLMRSLISKIEGIADDNGADRILGVKVWLGALSHFSEAHFKEHFDVAAKGTRAEGAELTIELSDDEQHPQAQDVILEAIEIDDE